MYEELTNEQLFKLIARSLHSILDSGGVNAGRSLIARMFEAFEYLYDTTTGIPYIEYHLAINQDMIHDKTLFGREILVRAKNKVQKPKMVMRDLSLLEDFELTYLLLLKLLEYYDSGEADADGFFGRRDYLHIKAMKLLIEIDHPTEHLVFDQDRNLLIEEGEQRWRVRNQLST